MLSWLRGRVLGSEWEYENPWIIMDWADDCYGSGSVSDKERDSDYPLRTCGSEGKTIADRAGRRGIEGCARGRPRDETT